MKARKDRIIIDTNLWISFILTGNFSKLDLIFKDKTAILLFSKELLEEFIEVAHRPKFEKYFSFDDLQDVLEQIRLNAEFIEVKTTVEICRDPKDNFLLSLAADGKANFLLTGDKDLLSIEKYSRTKILTMSDYLLRNRDK